MTNELKVLCDIHIKQQGYEYYITNNVNDYFKFLGANTTLTNNGLFYYHLKKTGCEFPQMDGLCMLSENDCYIEILKNIL